MDRTGVKTPEMAMVNKKGYLVKLYALNEEDQLWSYVDTGYVYSTYVKHLQGLCLHVCSESDGSLILESKIHPRTTYKKKRDLLIIWSEAESHGMALSFRNKAGCQMIWEVICRVQGVDVSVNNTQDPLDTAEEGEEEEEEEEEDDDDDDDEMSETGHLVNLLNCELNNLKEIANLVTKAFLSSASKKRLALILENENYIKKLLQMFHTCETSGDIEGLHQLHTIIKIILLLNKTPLYEIMFSDECIMNVVGCLEYDPALTQPKRHREFLTQHAKFKEVVPIANCELRQKIHQVYRVQYVLDILLSVSSVFVEHSLSDFKSFIYFNKVEIIHMVESDNEFLPQVLTQLKDKTTDDNKWRELILFFKEFCSLIQELQPESTGALLKTLAQLGILPALKIAMSLDDLQIRSAAIDIFVCLVEHSPLVIQEVIMKEVQCNEDCNIFINLIIKQMICDTDQELGNALHLMELLYYLLNPDNMLEACNNYEKSEFLHYFYTYCMDNLIAPILATTSDDACEEDDVLGIDKNTKNCLNNYQTAQLLSLILDLLTFCVQHHTYHIKTYILNRDLLKSVLILMNSKHTFLILCALRFMRSIIGIKDTLYNRYIIKGNYLEPVVYALLDNGTRYNMLNSAILELFEYIRVENIKPLVKHIIEKFYTTLECIEYVQTFKGLKMKYEEEEEQRSCILKKLLSLLRNKMLKRSFRIFKEEKLRYKKNKEEGEAVMQPLETDSQVHYMETKKSEENKNKADLPEITSSGGHKFTYPHSVGDTSGTGSSTGSNLVRLVDYQDDDEEEKEDETSSRKSPCFSP